MSAAVSMVLSDDPGLARDLPQDRRRVAQTSVVARVVELASAAGPAILAAERLTSSDPAARGAGLLTLDGLLLRRSSSVAGRYAAELLGKGDLLRPWASEDEISVGGEGPAWRVIEPARFAVLDAAFLDRLAPFPEVHGRLIERAMVRSRNFAALMAIVHHPRLEVRLHLLLWHLAVRWGRAEPDCVHLGLELSHATLADLVAVRRPSVTTALGRLDAAGLVRREAAGWTLLGRSPLDPPGVVATALG